MEEISRNILKCNLTIDIKLNEENDQFKQAGIEITLKLIKPRII